MMQILSPETLGGDANCNELLQHLQSGIIPAKFTYLGKGAELWKTLMASSNSVANEPEVQLLLQRLPALKKNFKNGSNIVDIGPGDGGKVIEILEHWDVNTGWYFGVDISPDILSLAEKRVQNSHPRLRTESGIFDLEFTDFRKSVVDMETKTKMASLFLLLGQTLGNPRDIPKFLLNVRKSMSKDSMLLIGLDLYGPEKIADLLKEYSNPAYLDMDLWVLKEAGLNPGTNGHVKIDFDERTRDIRGIFVLEKDVTIGTRDRRETIQLKKGREILFFRSHRFTEAEIKSTLEHAGLQMLDLQVHAESGYSLVTAKPRN